MHFKAACQFGFVLFFTAQGRMFVTVFPMVCHILAFLVSFYIKNLSQTVQCLYFGAELPLQVPAGPCPPRRASAAARALPALSHREPRTRCLFQFPFGIKVFHLARREPWHVLRYRCRGQPRRPLPRGVRALCCCGRS